MARHRWVKLRLHVYICGQCGTGKVNAERGGEWVATYHCPDGKAVESSHVPPCERGVKTAAYIEKYQDEIAMAEEDRAR